MRDKPPLSILIPWYERDELRLTLAANAPVFRGHDSEILILNCGSSSERLRGLITASEVAGVRQLDISVPGFNKWLALNVGLAHARADTVFTLDSDIVLLGPLPVEAMDEGSFLTIESVYESAAFDGKQTPNDSAVASPKRAFVEFTFRGGVKVRHQVSLRDASGNVRTGHTGLLLAKKADLLNIHGYNSDLEPLGWEDDDVLVRLQYALGRRRVQSGAALHLTHGDNPRFPREARAQSHQRNFIKCCRNYNNGVFLGSYHSDIARLSDKVTETFVDSPRPNRMAGDG
jgi:glycosyltransferase involved in cell wall biosynthesis